MDAELSGSDKNAALARLLSSPQERALWHAYHVVGDVLRSDELSSAAADLQFLAKLEARLAQEPPIKHVAALGDMYLSGLPRPATVSANAAVFKWRAIAGAACTVLVAVVGALVWAPQTPSISLASGNAPTSVSALNTPLTTAVVMPDGMIRDPRLDLLLNAHQQLGGHSALQMPSGFLRSATYEGVGR